MPGSTTSADSVDHEKAAARQASRTLFHASIVSFAASLLFLMSFSSPYWLQSWEDTQSPFKNMGLWQFCFDRFRFPKFQFDRLFNGCHAVWGDEFRVIREWLLPWWLMLVQLLAILAFMTSFSGLLLDTCLLLRWPLEHVLRFEFHLVLMDLVTKGLTAVLLFLCLAVFGGSCWDRGWLLYPNYNYVSWSYAFGVFSMFGHAGAAYLMFLEANSAKERKERNMALVMQMYPTTTSFAGSLSTYHGSQFI